MTALEIEVKGECEPISVILQPYTIHVPGSILVETSVKKPFRVIVLYDNVDSKFDFDF